jgi:hypothetical protein
VPNRLGNDKYFHGAAAISSSIPQQGFSAMNTDDTFSGCGAKKKTIHLGHFFRPILLAQRKNANCSTWNNWYSQNNQDLLAGRMFS